MTNEDFLRLTKEVEWRTQSAGDMHSVSCRHIPTNIVSGTVVNRSRIHAQTKCLEDLHDKLQARKNIAT